MFKKAFLGAVLMSVALLSGCASVPMAPVEQDAALKTFSKPASDKAGLYVFRNTFVGQALKKTVSLDGSVIGETANKVYFYREISPGQHTLSTESEFSDNEVTFLAESETNYFAEQYIKLGVFVGGANVQIVSEEDGKKGVLESQLAR
jgi:hypothetical protein